MKQRALSTRIRITEKMLTLPVIDFFPNEGPGADEKLRNSLHLKEVLIKNILSLEEADNLHKRGVGVIEIALDELEARFIKEINKRNPRFSGLKKE